jgi:hypothetical protein
MGENMDENHRESLRQEQPIVVDRLPAESSSNGSKNVCVSEVKVEEKPLYAAPQKVAYPCRPYPVSKLSLFRPLFPFVNVSLSSEYSGS